jgi:hypothetical protein
MRVLELHAPVRVVQRSAGRSATAAAAYRAAERIECERTGQVHDYSRKRGVEGSALYAAEGAPAWTRDRKALWNAAEMREKHPRAQPAREIELAFPTEFNSAQRREAGDAVARLLVFRYGSAVDVSWHSPSRDGDQRNYHAHILFTGRAIGRDGWAKTKQNALDDRTPMTLEDGTRTSRGQQEVTNLRAAVAGVLNQIAARDNVPVYVEHLSFQTRGLDREATQHLGPNATEMERRGEPSDIGNDNRAREARNAQREALYEERDNIIDLATAREKYRKRTGWELFYTDTQARRTGLARDLEARFGQQERETTETLAAINAQRDQRRFAGRLWWKVTGKERDERERMLALEATLHSIASLRQKAQEDFENDRRQRMENLKSEIAETDSRGEREFNALDPPAMAQASTGTDGSSGAQPSVSATYESRRAAFMERSSPGLTPERTPDPE